MGVVWVGCAADCRVPCAGVPCGWGAVSVSASQIVVREEQHLSPRTEVEMGLLRKRLKGLDPEAEAAAKAEVEKAAALAAGTSPPPSPKKSTFELLAKLPGRVAMRSLRLGDRLARPIIAE